MSSLLDKIKKNSTMSKNIMPISDSKFFGKKSYIPTPIPILNLALSGDIDKGLPSSGLTMLAAESKHFKSNLALLMAAAFQKQHKDGIILFYDTEFGITPEYLTKFDMDLDRLIHIPITSIEELSFELVTQLSNLDEKDNVFVFIDSVGNLSSQRNIDNLLKEKSTPDIQRAKDLKALFRAVTPYLNIKNIPMVVINHVYQDVGSFFGGSVVSGGSSMIYSADCIIQITRAQDKNSKGNLDGWNFTMVSDKSRFVREKSKFPFSVSFEKGIYKWSGLLELGIEGGFIVKQGDSHALVHREGSKLYIKGATSDKVDAFFTDLLENTNFKEFCRNRYSLSNVSPVANSELDMADNSDNSNTNEDEDTKEIKVNFNPTTGEVE